MMDLINKINEFLEYEKQRKIDYQDTDNIIIHGIEREEPLSLTNTPYVIVTKDKKDYVIDAINKTISNNKPILKPNEPIFLSYGINRLIPLLGTLRDFKAKDNKTYVIYGTLSFDDLSKLCQEFGDTYTIEAPHMNSFNPRNTRLITNRYGSKGVVSELSESFVERYRCDCGDLKGRLFDGILCPECNTKVKYVDDILPSCDNFIENIPGENNCGTTKTVKTKLTESNIENFKYRFILQNDKLIHLTPENIYIYLNTEVNLRTPLTCNNKDVCNTCQGTLISELSLRQEKETDKKFASIMKSHGKGKCPSCKKIIDRGDVSWNNPSTEAGTPMTVVEIQCQKCYTEIAHGTSWHPGAEDFEEFVDEVLEDIFEDRN